MSSNEVKDPRRICFFSWVFLIDHGMLVLQNRKEVIPTVLLDFPISLALGHFFALIGSRSLEQYSNKFADTYMKPLVISMIYMVGCFLPITGYFYFAYPAWSLSYIWNPDDVPGFVGLIVLSGYLFTMMLGWVSAAFWVVRRLRWVAFLQFFWSLSLIAIVFWLTFDAWRFIGEFSQYHSGLARDLLHAGHFLVVMAVLGGILIAGAGVVAWLIWKDGRRRHPEIRLGSS